MSLCQVPLCLVSGPFMESVPNMCVCVCVHGCVCVFVCVVTCVCTAVYV